jgi:signal peptidase II
LRKRQHPIQAVGMALIAGGALGNIIDRLCRDSGWMRGRVVDFVDLQWWPVFNVADSAITIGAVLLVIRSFLEVRPPDEEGLLGAPQ